MKFVQSYNKDSRTTSLTFFMFYPCLLWSVRSCFFRAIKINNFTCTKIPLWKRQKFTFWRWTEWRNGYSKQTQSYRYWTMTTRIILQRGSVKLRYKMTNYTHYVRIENKAKEAVEFHEQNCFAYCNMDWQNTSKTSL